MKCILGTFQEKKGHYKFLDNDLTVFLAAEHGLRDQAENCRDDEDSEHKRNDQSLC